MSKKVIEALQRVMPDIETRKSFVRNIENRRGLNFFRKQINHMTLHDLCWQGFVWERTPERDLFWRKIVYRLSKSELELKINLAELE
jgi:hypothetical protein